MSDNLPALADLANQINAEHEACHFAMRESIKHAVRAGELLVEAKMGLPHGQWASWLDANCDFSHRTARAYMRLAKELPKLDEANRQRVAEMPLREALTAITGMTRSDLSDQSQEPPDFTGRSRRWGAENLAGIMIAHLPPDEWMRADILMGKLGKFGELRATRREFRKLVSDAYDQDSADE